MSFIRGDASEFYQLAADLSDVGSKAVPAVRGGMADAGRAVERSWRSAASKTHDSHAKYYADSIDSELVFGVSTVAVDIGPNTAKKQGFLGRILETGGERSPAYLLGLKALDENEHRVEKAIDQAINPLFP